MKVYALYHSVMHEGNDLIAMYSTKERAELEAKKLQSEYDSKAKTAWEKMSKSGQKFWGTYKKYRELEYFYIIEHEVIE